MQYNYLPAARFRPGIRARLSFWRYRMDSAVFEELLVSALEKPSKKTLDALLAQLATAGNPIPAVNDEI